MGGKGDTRGWDGWMVSPTQWTCIWVNSRSSWWTGKPGVLQSMGLQRVKHDWATELNWLRVRNNPGFVKFEAYVILKKIKINKWASLIVQLVRVHLQCRRAWFDSWVGKIPWKRDRLPTPVFLCFPCGSASKESVCNAGDLGLIPRWRSEWLPTQVFWPGEFHGLYSPWGLKEWLKWLNCRIFFSSWY